MADLILDNEPAIRLSIVLGVLVLVAAWESLRPRRVRSFSRWRRCFRNQPSSRIRIPATSSRIPVTSIRVERSRNIKWAARKVNTSSIWPSART